MCDFLQLALVFQSCRKMNVISSGSLKEESNSSATYTIVIDDFNEKLAKSAVGDTSASQEFSINWSKFSISLFIAGKTEESRGHLSLFLNNKSDWMVRANFEIFVKVMGNNLKVKNNVLMFYPHPILAAISLLY